MTDLNGPTEMSSRKNKTPSSNIDLFDFFIHKPTQLNQGSMVLVLISWSVNREVHVTLGH